jgi:hypothetical protein
VPAATERAFELFTAGIGEWWPLATHSVGQDQATSVVFGEGVGGNISLPCRGDRASAARRPASLSRFASPGRWSAPAAGGMRVRGRLVVLHNDLLASPR